VADIQVVKDPLPSLPPREKVFLNLSPLGEIERGFKKKSTIFINILF
jgi:hypothetical protein